MKHKHITHVIKEARKSMQFVEYRVKCECGWSEKSLSFNVAQDRGELHKQVMENPYLYKNNVFNSNN